MLSSNRSVTVPLGDRSYRVVIGQGLIDQLGALLRRANLKGTVALITDDRVQPLYASRATSSLTQAGYKTSLHVVPHGERSKSFTAAEQLCESLSRAGIDRSSVAIALGGGVIGDLAGFVASIFARGISYVQVPTTVMAQVDSSVGGKTAVNLQLGKNLVGTFHQPLLVIIDPDSLQSLGRREKNEGLAEVIKYGVIADRTLLDDLHSAFEHRLNQVIERCVAIKAEIVANDEQERSGKRELLNFGHTLGHAIEAAAGYGRLLHGEAISLGMRAATWLSTQKAGLAVSEYERLIRLLREFELPVTVPPDLLSRDIMERVFADKKFRAGQIRFVLTSGFGTAFVSEKITRADLESAVESLRELSM
ncbi:MAG: 3-dehydroquinate synthase [Verrucomicrobia bacterium]|nr:3-dehydroquinate synthase [Verrucomicrobiota bacterium]